LFGLRKTDGYQIYEGALPRLRPYSEGAYIIKAFMYSNPRATKMDVFMETGISLRVIDRVSGV
jgi:hypothetical protein